MNRIFRVIWSHSVRQWIAVSELGGGAARRAPRCRSAKRRRLAAAAAFASILASGTAAVMAAPTGGQVTGGSGTVTQSGNTTTIRQTSSDLFLNWQSFDVTAGEVVDFVQPNSSAIAVNRILSNTGSTILGHLEANGQVWLINPNGVLFGKGAQVDVGGITASTLAVSDAAIESGVRTLSGPGSGSVVNQGSIIAADGGYVALIGNQVSNQGVIAARLGTVALGAGSAETLTFDGSRLIHLAVDRSTLNDLAQNRQLIQADGGQVIMTAGAKDALLASVVNNSGIIEARSVGTRDGRITLLAGMEAGTVEVGGTLDASSPASAGPTPSSSTASGGVIETSGATLEVAQGARISAGRGGSWVVDPVNLTINAAAATTIDGALNSGTSVTETTTATGATGSGTQSAGPGDIDVNSAISWSNASASLTLSAYHGINVNAAVNGAGAVTMDAAGSNLTIASGGSVYGGAGVTLGTGGNFVNQAGSTAVSAGAAGRWLIYSTNPAADTVDGLAPNFLQYDAAYQAAPAQATGNGLLYSIAPSITVSAVGGSVTKTYDGTATATLSGSNFTATGTINGDAVSAMTGAFQSTDVGSGITVSSAASATDLTVMHGSVPVYGYQLAGSPVSGAIGSITPATLTALIIGDPTKVYDGTVTATLSSTNYQLSGFVAGQGAAVNQPSSVGYQSASAGSQTVNATFANTNFVANSGTNLSNYSLPTTASGAGTITQAPLIITGVLATNKVYDGTTTDALNLSQAGIYGVIGSDAVSLSTTGAAGTFASKNVGSGIAVTTGGFSLTGAQAADYQLVQPPGLTASITPATLTVGGVLATNKVYDGATTDPLNVSGATLSGVIAGDVGTVGLATGSAVGAFSTKNVGTDLAVDVSGLALSGSGASNYTLAQPTGFTADITPKAITVALTGTPTKPYNGTDTAVVTSSDFTLSGFVSGEGATIPQTLSTTYASANAGTQNVTALLTTADYAANSGTLLSNYTLVNSVTGSGTITPALLTGSIIGNPTKVYDSTTSASLSSANYSLSGFVAGQSATVDQTVGAYASPNAGVQPVSASLTPANYVAGSGTLMSNYTLPTTLSGTGTITQASVTGYVQAGIVGNPTKTYDGTTVATLTSANYILTGFTSGQGATVTQTVGQYASANAGTQTVSATLDSGDFTANSGTNLANYHLPTAAYGSGTINPATLTVSIVNDPTRVYNGGTSMTLSASNYSLTGFVSGEGASINPSALINYASANVGLQNISAVLTPSAYTADSGTQMSNYVMPALATGTGHITPAPLIVTGVYATNKVYDTTNADPLNVAAASLAGIVASDAGNVSLQGAPAGTFSTVHVGTDLPVSVNGYSLGGSAASNYVLEPVTGLAANITPAPLSIAGVTAVSKPYDGTAAAALVTSGDSLVGVLGSDTVGLSNAGAQGTFASIDVGTALKVATSGFTLSGASAGDYALVQPSNLTANITAAPVTATIIGNPTKVYDGSASTTLTAANYTLSGFVAGQGATVPQSATATYASPNAGSGITINSTLVLSDFAANAGTNLSNYALPATGTGTGTITQAPLTVALIGTPTKTYDSTTAATLASSNYQLTGFVGSQSATITQTSGTYASASAGAEPVTATLASGDYAAGNGTSLSNYALPTSATGPGLINRAPLTASGVTTTPQIYNGTTVDALGGTAVFTGTVYGTDAPTLTNTATGTLGNSGNAGLDAVTTNFGLSGAGSANYVVIQPSGLTALISPKTLSASATSTKVYNGTDSAPLSGADTTFTGFVAGQGASVDAGVAGTFTQSDVGTGLAVTGVPLTTSNVTAHSGTLLSNYTLPATDNGTGSITPATLTYTAQPASSVYGTTPSGLTGAVIGFVAGQNLASATTGTAAFSTTATSASNVGSYAIDGSGLTANNGNYVFAQAPANATALTITPASLSVLGVSVSTTSRVYNGSDIDALTGATITGTLYNGDHPVLANDTTGILNNSGNVGTDTVTTSMTLTGSGAGNYTLTQPSGLTAVISPAQLTATASVTKSYDGTTVANLAGGNTLLTGWAPTQGATVNSGVTGTFAQSNAGSGIAITGGALTAADLTASNGTLLTNYLLPSSVTGTGTITPAVVNLSGSRVYDAATDAAAGTFGASGTVNGVAGQTLTLSGGGTLAGKNVGTQSLSSLGTLVLGDGTGSASNYTLVGGTDTVAVTPLAITVTATAANRAYDGTTAATGVVLSSGGVLGTDTVSFADTAATFDTKNVGNGKTVTISGITAGGAEGSDYSVNATTTTTADITPAIVNLTGSRTYDGLTDAAAAVFGANGTINTGVGSETLVLSGLGTLVSKNAGVEALGSLGTLSAANGTGLASNYTLVGGTDSVTVSKLALDVTATAANKVYDGTTAATVTLSSSGVVAGDALSFTDTGATFATKNVGTGETVTVSGISDSGADAVNYTLANTSTTTLANITPLGITVSGTAQNKVYNGTTVATVETLTGIGVLAGDTVTFTDTGATFATKNVGAGKTVTIAGISAGGADGEDYSVNTTATTTANITPLAVSVTATGTNRAYDGTVNDAAVLTSSGVLAGDSVVFTDTTSTFANKNVGNGKTVTVSGIEASGADGGNYTVSDPTTSTTADITPRTLTVSGTAQNKVYDGTTAATVTLSSSGVVAGDALSFTDTGATFATKNVGTGETVTVSGISDSGADAVNYTLANTSTTTLANITPLGITVSGTAQNKVYNGTTVATVETLTGIGVLAGDTVTFTDTGATFATKNVGAGKTVTIAGISAGGADGEDYSVNTTATTTANITPATLTETATAVSVPQGQQPPLTGTVSGFVPGDSIANATTGTLAWIANTPAWPATGTYAIDGRGLSAQNYVIVQAPGNSDALTVTSELIAQGNPVDRIYGLIALPLSPERLATPLGVGSDSERSNNTGNAKLDPDPARTNKRLTDFKDHTGLTVIGPGVRLPQDSST